MTRKVETIDLSDSSTSLKVALMEALGEGTFTEADDSDEGSEETNENPRSQAADDPDVTEKSEGDSAQDDMLLSGVSTKVTETPDDENVTEERVERETLFFFEETNKVHKGAFRPEDPDEQGRGFPIFASGQIDTILIIAQDSTFKATLSIDGDEVVNDTWSNINSISQELAHIGAYSTDSDKYVMSIADYPFNESVDLSIRATQQTTFDTIRVEMMIDEYTKGPE